MTRTLLGLALVSSLAFVSCGKSGEGTGGAKQAESLTPATPTGGEDIDAVSGITGTNQNDETPSSISTSTTVPPLALSFRTNINYLNTTSAQEVKYNQAVAIVKKVVATEAFRRRILSYTYNGVQQFANNAGKTNAQIYQSILDAAEKLKPVRNNTLDLGVKMYYDNNSVIGFTNPTITYINVNTKFFNSFAANQVAGNLFHEWLHKLGYGHDFSPTARRPYSVPYAIGYIVRDLGKNFL